MKVLLTGASGFVGSHVLDELRRRNIPAAVLLRPSSNTRFIDVPAGLEKRFGSLRDGESLRRVLDGISHVIHCAGCTRAARLEEFDLVNNVGTRTLAEQSRLAGVQRFVHISSLAAAGPAGPEQPVREADPPRPVSVYGRSKLSGESAVINLFPEQHVILRPPAVYGPRDGEFLRLFKAAAVHIAPRPAPQPLSLVFVEDLARVTVECVDHPAAIGKTFHVGHKEIVTARSLAMEIARQTGDWCVPVPLPSFIMWPMCLLAEAQTRITGRPNVLSWQKHAELTAKGWVCDCSRLENELGLRCQTGLTQGVAQTLQWYRSHKWL